MRSTRTIAALFMLAAAAAVPQAGAAVSSLISLSTAPSSMDGVNGANAVAVDSADNIIVTGQHGNQIGTVKYNRSLLKILGKTDSFGGVADIPHGVVTDSLDHIIIAGESQVGGNLNYFTIKYDSNFQTVIASATAGGANDDRATAVTRDSQDNVIVAGYTSDGYYDNYYTVKYTPQLGLQASALDHYEGWGQASGVAVDGQDNIIVTGSRSPDYGEWSCYTIKYDADFNDPKTASFGEAGGYNQANAVAVDRDGNVIVAGCHSNGANLDYLVLKYDANLVLRSSASFDSGTQDIAFGVAADSRGNIIVTGYSGAGSARDYCTLKYSPSLVLLSSGAYDSGGDDMAAAVAVDHQDALIVTGKSGDDYRTVKYNGTPLVLSAVPAVQGRTTALRLTGRNFVEGTTVSFPSGITAAGITVLSQNQITTNVTVPAGLALGKTAVTVTGPNGESTLCGGALDVVGSLLAEPAQVSTLGALTSQGTVTLSVPAGAVAVPSTFTVAALVSTDTLTGAPLPLAPGAEISLPAAAGPFKEVTLSFPYRDADVAGHDVSRLGIAYFNPQGANGPEWVALRSTVYASEHRVTCTTRYLNRKFALIEVAPGTGGGTVNPPALPTGFRIYPNPYKPGSGGDYDNPDAGEGIVFASIPHESSIKIFTIAGDLVFTQEVVADNTGSWLWDTKDKNGEKAASGVYLYIIKGANDGSKTMKGKLSIIR